MIGDGGSVRVGMMVERDRDLFENLMRIFAVVPKQLDRLRVCAFCEAFAVFVGH